MVSPANRKTSPTIKSKNKTSMNRLIQEATYPSRKNENAKEEILRQRESFIFRLKIIISCIALAFSFVLGMVFQGQMTQVKPLPPSGAGAPSTSLVIENKELKKEVADLNRRMKSLEDSNKKLSHVLDEELGQ